MFPIAARLLLAQVSASVLPVLVFLFALELIDTYKLLTLGRVLRSVAVGCGVAAICYGAEHRGLCDRDWYRRRSGRDPARR